MPLLHNSVEYNDLRQTLRQTLSHAEIALWLQLKKHGCCGYKFRRQHGIGRYIVDFYCPQLKLAIEVDGSQHFETNARAYDHERDCWLAAVGIQVVRFTTYDVINHIDSVIDALREVVRRRALEQPPRLRHRRRHPSSYEEGK